MSRVLDFLRPPRTSPAKGWVLLGIGLMTAATTYALNDQWSRERAAVKRDQALRIEQRRAQMRRALPVPPTPQDRLALQIRAELDRPWLPALRAIETAASDPVYLLSMAVDAGTGAIKVEAEAPTFDHALSFAQVLADGAGIASAALTSHEQATDPGSGRSVFRFSVLARWSAP